MPKRFFFSRRYFTPEAHLGALCTISVPGAHWSMSHIKVTKIAVTWLAYSYSKRHMHNEPTIGNQCGHYACQRRSASTQRVNLLGWGKILSVKNVTTKWKRVYPSPRSQALKCLYHGCGRCPNFNFSGAPNDGFLLNTLKTLFRLSRVLLDL